jgi:2-polyprenyl-6-methoxyphenol hydroxylase-like FAD-dependent oxidoreductase
VEKPEVVIIGAGPAEMFLAYLLVPNGIAVRVLERHTDFKREFRGEGIRITGSTWGSPSPIRSWKMAAWWP